jgi:hypothetical protein
VECKNCGFSMTREQNFCSSCGAKLIRNRLTLKNLWHEVSERIFNVDNTFIKTFKALFTNPEEVIDGFIGGVRKKYLNPINYVAITVTFSGLVYYLIIKFRPDFYSNLNFQGQNKEAFSESMANIMDFQGLIYFLSIPLMAVISMIVFLNIKKYNFTEHNVIYMYTGAQSSVLTSTLIIILLPFYAVAPLWLNISLYVIMIGFNAYVLKRLFQLNAKRLIIKTLYFLLVALVLYIILVVFFGILIGIYAAVTGNIPEAFVRANR